MPVKWNFLTILSSLFWRGRSGLCPVIESALLNTNAPFGQSLSKPDAARPSTNSGPTVFKGRVNKCHTRVWLAMVLGWIVLAGAAQGAEPLKIGVLAHRPKPQVLAQWQPLAAALNRALPKHAFQIVALSYPEMEDAVRARQLDFVLTNPGHYALLVKRSGVASALATLVLDNQGQALMAFGGVIFTLADNASIDSLTDLKGKTLAVTNTGSLGGYQMQAYELKQAGIDLPAEARLRELGMPHDTVVNAVLAGQADAGFVRTGVLEQMIQEGKLQPNALKVINLQKLSGFPQQASTRLYPEWPFAAMPHIDQDLARHVAAALFLLEENQAVVHAMHIHGFTVPADYSPIIDLLRELRMPPFDVIPRFTLLDVWERYRAYLLLIAGVIGLIGMLAITLLLTRRQLLVQQAALQTQKREIQQKQTFLSTLIQNLPDLVWLKNVEGIYLACNSRFEQFLGAPESIIVGNSDYDFVETAVADAFRHNDRAVIRSLTACVNEEWVRFASDGHKELLETTKVPMLDADGCLIGVLGIGHDITQRKQAEENLQLAAMVFKHAREGILITDADGIIIDVNQTFTSITEYSREDVVGRKPSLLSSGRQNKAFYEAMWRDLIETGHWSGEVWNRRKSGEVYAELLTISAVKDAAGSTQHYVALFSDITPFKEYEQQLERIAHFDALTGLPNRILLADRLRQAMSQVVRHQQKLAVVFLDLDGFKAVNDNHGHDVGDQVLMVLASRMKQVLRETDTLARLGGDEFVAVLVDLPDIETSKTLLNRLLDVASQPVIIQGVEMTVSASIGVSCYPERVDIDADQLLRQADQAMYQAKLTGKNRYHVFDADQDGSVRSHYESLETIALSLKQHELVLYYQPKINMRSGQVVGVEALIRWQHPQKGLLTPSMFLPVIENHALAVTVGEWVMNSALQQCRAWGALGLALPVSINVSARQLQHPDFITHLQALLNSYPDVKPGSLEIEILESSALEDVVGVSQVIGACRQMGIGFALDDFGTGYSSLTYLKHLPVSQLKIDQSFVRDMLDDADDLAILQGVLGLAAAFRLEVIAEGVETRAHGDRLLSLGCELAQGYGIARPMPADAIPAWIAAWQKHPVW